MRTIFRTTNYLYNKSQYSSSPNIQEWVIIDSRSKENVLSIYLNDFTSQKNCVPLYKIDLWLLTEEYFAISKALVDLWMLNW